MKAVLVAFAETQLVLERSRVNPRFMCVCVVCLVCQNCTSVRYTTSPSIRDQTYADNAFDFLTVQMTEL